MKNDHKYYYRAFGWNIASQMAFPELMPVDPFESADLSIRFGAVPTSLENAVKPGINTFTLKGQFILLINEHLRLRAIEGREVVIDRNSHVEDDEIRVYILASVFGAISHQRGLLPIHASAIEHEGKAYLFTGLTGSGKSSIAAGLHERGYQVYAEDLSAVSIEKNAFPTLNFGSIRIKLWADTMKELGIDSGNCPRIRKDLEKFSYPIHHTSLTPAIPVERFYVITPAHQSTMEFRELKQKDRFRYLLTHTFRQRLIAGLGVEVAHFKMCEQLSRSISAYEFIRPIEGGGISQTVSILEQHIKSAQP